MLFVLFFVSSPLSLRHSAAMNKTSSGVLDKKNAREGGQVDEHLDCNSLSRAIELMEDRCNWSLLITASDLMA
jgi:hypothetical protein